MRSAFFFNYLVEAELMGSGMVLLLMLVRRLFRKWLGSGIVYAAWLLVALRLLLPLSLPNVARFCRCAIRGISPTDNQRIKKDGGWGCFHSQPPSLKRTI